MGWVNPSSLFGEIDQQRESETEQARLRRLGALRSRARTSQQPIMALVEPVRIGHRPKLEATERERRRVANAIGKGASQPEAARAVGWSAATLSRRLRDDPQLRAAVDDAMAARRQRMTGETHYVQYVKKVRLSSGQVRFYSACRCGWKPLSNLTPALARKAIADHAQRERAS